MIDENSYVRIVVLNFNQPEYTISTVNALLLQDIATKEIVVVDNYSSSLNYELLQSHLPKEVILLRSNSNIGYSKGNNLGCKFKSENNIGYYFIVNNDVIIEDRNLIYKLLKSIRNHHQNKVVAASPLINTISSGLPLSKQIQIRRILSFSAQVIVNSPIMNKIFRSIFNKYVYKDKMPFINKYTISDTINGAAFIIKADVFEQIGMLDEGTFLFFEEIILGKQLKLLGYQCVLDGNSTVKHLQGLSTQSNKSKYNIKMEKEKIASEIYYYKKYFITPTVLSLLIKKIRILEIYLLKIIKK